MFKKLCVQTPSALLLQLLRKKYNFPSILLHWFIISHKDLWNLTCFFKSCNDDQERNQLIFSGVQTDWNLLLYLTTKHVFKIFWV